jgi:hypothetical protein
VLFITSATSLDKTAEYTLSKDETIDDFAKRLEEAMK